MRWFRTPAREACEVRVALVPYFERPVDDEDPADYCGTLAERARELEVIRDRGVRYQAEARTLAARAGLEEQRAKLAAQRAARVAELPAHPRAEPCEPVPDPAHRERVAAAIAPLSRDRLREVCAGMGLTKRGEKPELTKKILDHADRYVLPG